MVIGTYLPCSQFSFQATWISAHSQELFHVPRYILKGLETVQAEWLYSHPDASAFSHSQATGEMKLLGDSGPAAPEDLRVQAFK